jgi:ABC-type multidrug transport system ATPase subunit
MNCFFDGMTVEEAVAFISRCYGETPTERQIKNAQKAIKDCTGKEWK